MARLRSEETPQPDIELPPELETCVVEAWESGEPPPSYVGESLEDLTTWRMATAYVRWKAARGAWCALHNVDPRTLPGSRPRWRSREAM